MGKQISIEEVKRRLKSRHDIESDELDTLFNKSEDKIREYYQQTVLRAKRVNTLKEEADGEGKIAEDTYKLDSRRSKEIEKQEKALIKAKAKPVAAVKAKPGSGKAQFDALQKSIKPEARVSFSEVKEAMSGIDDLLREDDDEEKE